jgi:hypothetical protein
MANDPHDPRPTGRVHVTLSGSMRGFDLTLQLDADIRKLDATLGYLSEQGLKVPVKPIAWSYTADGLPICPKHKFPMRKREKQGDTWHSHNCGTEKEPLWCKGYAGPDSPGFFADLEEGR